MERQGFGARIVWTDQLSRLDMVMIRKAIANGWDVPPETRARVVDGLMAAMDGGHVRTALAVGRTAVAMEGDNIRHERASRDAQHGWPTD